MDEERIDVIIHADGRVEIKVEGVKGDRCTELTAAIEAALGGGGERTFTSEFYETENQEEQKQQHLGG